MGENHILQWFFSKRIYNKFKKASVLSFVMAIILVFSTIPASAYKIGDTVGYALSTDIVATINGYDIPSYNVDGYTYIVAEDLRYYGFAVNYDNASRSLSISRDYSQSWVSKAYTKPYVSSSSVGKREHSLLYTDIKTYLDGYYTHSYNINGQTIIRFDSLSAYGGVSYDNNKREISLGISWMNINPNPVDRSTLSVLGYYANPSYPDNYNVMIYACDGNKISFEITAIKGANASRITGINVTGKLVNGKCTFNFEDSFGTTGTGTLTVVDKDTITLSFNVKSYGFWGVDAAAGTHKRVSDVPYDFEPWTNSLY